MSRARAFLIHFGLSSLVFLVLLALIVFVWYPQPFFTAEGGWQGIRLIAFVDLVIGPGLTLAVFRSGKPGLRFDLSVIAALQAAALAWGISTVYTLRPALITYIDGTFYTLSGETLEEMGSDARRIVRQSTARPAWAYLRLPAEKNKEIEAKLKAVFAGMPLYRLGYPFEPLGDDNWGEALDRALPVERLRRQGPEAQAELDGFLHRRGGSAEPFAFFPLLCRYRTITLAFDRHTGRLVGGLAIDASDAPRLLDRAPP